MRRAVNSATMKSSMRRHIALATILALGTGACVDQRERTVARLAETGTVEARWDVREEERKLVHTFVLVRSGDALLLWDVMSADGYRSGNLEQAGGVENGGCFLFVRGEAGVGPLRVDHRGRLVRSAARRSTSERTPTTCAEYEGTPAAPVVARVVSRAKL